jgi:hypothetical protein
LVIYGHLILPERDLDATVRRLTPMLNDPSFSKKVEDASVGTPQDTTGVGLATNVGTMDGDAKGPMLAQVVGIIIGSPEYQRR